jgi:hypothetical protein
MDVKPTWCPTWHQMDHGHLDYFQKLPLVGRPNITPKDHGTPDAHNRQLIIIYHV